MLTSKVADREITVRRRRVSGGAVTAVLCLTVSLALNGALAQTGTGSHKPGTRALKLQAAHDSAASGSRETISNRKAVQLLRRMIQAERTQAYSAREATFGSRGETEEAVKHDPKRGTRRESLRPTGEIFVDNYSRSWLLSTRNKTITERPSLAKRRQSGDVIKRLLKQKLPVERVGEEKVAGRITDIVSVTVKGSASREQVSRRFWIDRQTGLRLRSEDRGPGGRILASAYYLSIDMTPTFSADEFSRPVPPADFKSFTEDRETYRSYDAATKAGISVQRPGYLPTGFRLRSVDVIRKSGGKRTEQRISQRYDNGLSVLTLVQSDGFVISRRTMNPQDKKRDSGFFALPRGQRAYLWRDKDTKLAFALLGSLPDEELKRIADSVK